MADWCGAARSPAFAPVQERMEERERRQRPAGGRCSMSRSSPCPSSRSCASCRGSRQAVPPAASRADRRTPEPQSIRPQPPALNMRLFCSNSWQERSSPHFRVSAGERPHASDSDHIREDLLFRLRLTPAEKPEMGRPDHQLRKGDAGFSPVESAPKADTVKVVVYPRPENPRKIAVWPIHGSHNSGFPAIPS